NSTRVTEPFGLAASAETTTGWSAANTLPLLGAVIRINGRSFVRLQRPKLFAGLSPVCEKLPPTNNPVSLVARADTIVETPVIPLPTGHHCSPTHRAKLRMLCPPARVKLPPMNTSRFATAIV